MKIRTELVYLLIFIIAGGSFSCTKPDITFGADYLDNNYTNVVVVDTATALVSTVLLDSFVTSGTSRAIIGKYTDPSFGIVTSNSYFPITPPAYSEIANTYENTTYDFLELIVRPNKSYYGDTAQPLNISVLQLDSQLAFADTSTVLYNKNSFAAKRVLGNRTLTVRPSVTDSISIRLDNVTGLDLYNKLKSKDPVIQSTGQFMDYFKGIRIAADGFMLGISDSVVMRLHYKKSGIVLENQKTDFTLSNRALQFNNISVDRAGTPLSMTVNQKEISSDLTSNTGFLQSATGSVVKVRFPYLREFLKVKSFLKIINAQLIITPVTNSFSGLYPLPPQVRLTQTTQANNMGGDLVTNSTTPEVLYGNLTIDYLYNRNTNYTYDVTSYINNEIKNVTVNQNGLLLSPPNPAFRSNLNRLLVGDKNNPNGSVKLRLFYVTVNL